MRVRVKLHGETKRGVAGLVGDVVEAELPDGITVGQALAKDLPGSNEEDSSLRSE